MYRMDIIFIHLYILNGQEEKERERKESRARREATVLHRSFSLGKVAFRNTGARAVYRDLRPILSPTAGDLFSK